VRTLFTHDCGASVSSSQIQAYRGFWSGAGTTNLTINSTGGRNSTPVIEIATAATNLVNYLVARPTPAENTNLYLFFRISTSNGTFLTMSSSYVVLKGTDNAGNELWSLRGNGGATGALDLYREGSLVQAGALALSTSQQVVEIYCKPAGSSAGILIMKVDGTTVYSSSSLTFTLTAGLNKVYFGNHAGTGNKLRLQDIIIQDTNGDSLTWLGPLSVLLTDFPTGDGASVQWTADGGGSHYVNVDETTSNDATDKERSTSTGNVDLFTFSALSTTYSTIYSVGIVATNQPVNTGGACYLQSQCRVGSTIYNGASSNIGASSWNQTCLAYFDKDPSTNAAWASRSAVDNAQFGIKHVAS
jgi:hypothetical protein